MDFQARTYQMGSALVYLTKAAAAHEISYALAGRLQLSQTGWLVVSAPAALVRGAFDALHEHTTELPEEYSIPVMTPAELARIGGADKVVERGNHFHYTLGPVRANEPSSNDISKVWYICIFSQELKRLRRSYDLEPMMQGKGYFRLPIAVRKVVPRATKEAIDYLAEPDWNEFDYEAIKAAALGHVEEDNGHRSSDGHVSGHGEDPIKVPVPNIKQLSNYSCGPSVLAAVEGFFDKNVSDERQMRSAVAAKPEHGTTPKKIIEAARADGFNVEPQVLATLGQVKAYLDRDIPVIMAIQAYSSDKDVQDLEGGHYVTAIGYDDEGLIFQDPAIEGDDARGYLPYEDLDKRWIDKDTDGKVYPQLAIAIWKDKEPEQTSKARERVKIALTDLVEKLTHNKHVAKWLNLPSTPKIPKKKLKLDAEQAPELLQAADLRARARAIPQNNPFDRMPSLMAAINGRNVAERPLIRKESG